MWRLERLLGDLERVVGKLEKRIDEIERRPTDGTIRFVIYGLLFAVVALGTGTAANLSGLLR